MVGLALETRLRALADRRSHDVGHILREERDIVADADQKPCCSEMIAQLDQSLRELIRVEQHKLVVQLEGDAVVGASDVFEGIEKDFMSILVVADLLFLLRDVDSDLDGLCSVA